MRAFLIGSAILLAAAPAAWGAPRLSGLTFPSTLDGINTGAGISAHCTNIAPLVTSFEASTAGTMYMVRTGTGSLGVPHFSVTTFAFRRGANTRQLFSQYELVGRPVASNRWSFTLVPIDRAFGVARAVSRGVTVTCT
ncbi:hypothetical protein LRS13_02825 [Svornostia abyssi]|uniref:Uncharacterized protein n=1 Tax=Svornostia abyssi TaxID=2898438 RepID=A0ABY5PIL7_9ACTN|nr:hypothetical protein LRS13_02825 [Parviterribacteraceae bacterium J379]